MLRLGSHLFLGQTRRDIGYVIAAFLVAVSADGNINVFHIAQGL